MCFSPVAAATAITTPHITSFTIENDGLTSPAGASITEGGAASTWTVKSIDITQNNPAVALESGGFCAGKVTITVNEDFSGYNFVWLVKNKWSVECEGGVLASGTGRKSMPKVSDYKCSNAFYLQAENAATDDPCYYYDLEIVSAITTPHITSFTIESDGLTSPAGASITEGGAASTWTVKSIDITQNNPAVALESGGFCAGKVTITVNEDFSGYNFVWLVKNKWSVECEGGVLASGTGRKSMPKVSDYTCSNAFYLQTENAATDAPCYYYDLELTYPGKTNPAPTLSAVENGVDRTSDTSATVKFTSDQAGTYYYAWNDADASEPPTISTSGSGTAMAAEENVIELSVLTAGAKKLYIMAKSADGTETESPLVLDIPAYVRPTHTLTISFMPGDKMAGYKVLSVTADGTPITMGKYGYTVETGAAVVVRVLIPDGKKVLESVTLARTDDATETFQAKVDGSASSFSFTMPDADTRFKSYTLKDADASDYRYNLSFKATLLWEEQGDQEKNRKGNVVFQNEADETVFQAKQGEQIIATAIPRTDDTYYKFAFSQWESATEGVTLPADTTTESFTFTMPANDVTLGAAFINVGTEISWRTVPAGADTTVKMIIFGNKQNPYTYRKTSEGGEKGVFNCIGTEWGTRYRFDHWEIYRDGEKLSDAEIDTTQTFGTLGQPGYYTVPKFDIAGSKMEIVGVFEEKSFAAVTVSVTPEGSGTASAAVGTESGTDLPIVFEGQTVTLTAAPADRYKLESWTVTAPGGTVIATTPDENDENKVTFVMPTFETSGGTVTAEAHFVIDQSQASGEKALSAELLAADGTSLGDKCTYSKEGGMITFTLAPDVDTSDLASMILKLTCSDYATVKRSGDDENWPAEGKVCNMTLGQEVTFVVTAENGDTATYTIKIVQQKLSSEAEISRVELLYGNDTFAFGTPDDTLTCTITLKDNIDSTLLSKIGVSDDVKMKITYTGASLAQADGHDDAEESSDKWSSGNVTCAIKPGNKAKFTVKAEDGTTKVYTIAITKPNVSEKPVLEEVSVNRTSAKEATVKFTSSAAGNYYYKVVESGAAKPNIDTSKGGTNAVADVNTIELSNLTKDARDIYIVVKNAAGDVSEPLMIKIPAFDEEPDTPDEGDFTITYTGPTGGKLVPSRTRANAGDKITVTAIPDAGMQMVVGSMKYTLGVAGGESTPITDGTFTMPTANVTLSCKWEAVKTSTDGITGFVIDGVVGVVDNTANTISVVMAYGTDVTKLIPIISGNNIASISPASGQMVDFTNPVQYTVTLTDGTVKNYIVTVYVQEGTAADKMWDKLTDFYDQTPWWEYADHQVSTGRYPKYW